ncbi:YwqI/YxiC family protein [Lentibacillus sp. L22]|uniref:YwqI/YxiC family protein n=1 Tax=Lentibacillus TaxID=175304 RepID=UPI0022B112A8|nr:YwqI/YxiC family protein [Lentibacillus daqui]
MTTEIKIEHNPIKQAITTLKGSAQNFQSSFPDEIEGGNHLDLLDQLNELNHTYATLLQSYQLLMLKHIHTTENSVASLMETDQQLGDYIGFLK